MFKLCSKMVQRKCPPLALIGGYVPTNPPPIALRKVGKFTHLSHGTKVLLLNNTRTL